jgi:hypothetical protein
MKNIPEISPSPQPEPSKRIRAEVRITGRGIQALLELHKKLASTGLKT